MRFKTLLLGSAAVIASAAGSAQAADLSVAEPVDYVRVCDAFGEGYWYIPGTDTCIAVSGSVEFGVYFGDNTPETALSVDIDENGVIEVEEHDADWAFYTTTKVNVEARSMTDWGPLVAFITMEGKHGFYDEQDYKVDEAFIQLGPLLLGYTDSVFDVQGGGYTDSGLDLSDNDANQVRLAWAFNGFGLAIAVEDTSERYGSSGDDSMPAIAAALTTEFSGWDAGLSFLYAPNDDPSNGDTTAIEGVVSTEVGMWQFQLAALWADGKGVKTWFDGDSGEGWAVSVSAQQNWQSNFYTAQTFVWSDLDGSSDEWGAAFTVAYSPVDSLWFYADAATLDEADSWDFKIFAEKKFGPNG